MGRLILHIGLPKTGSSAIQEFLTSNEKVLADHAVVAQPGGRSEVELAAAFSRKAHGAAIGAGITTEADRKAVRKELRRRLASKRPGDRVISSEHLSGMLRTPGEVGDLASFLGEFFQQILVVGVIRRADYWVPSAYAEAVRSGRDVRQRPPFVDRRAHLLDHDQLLSRWGAAFGADAVRLIPFLEQGPDDPPAALGLRFLEAAGITAGDHHRWSVPGRPSRPSLSGIGVEVLRRIAPELEVSAMSAAERERLVRLLSEQHPGDRVALTPSAHRALVAHGWIDTGIDDAQQAFGHDWPQWRVSEHAPIRRPPEPDDAVITATLEAVRAAGIGPSSQRGVARLTRRLLRRRSAVSDRDRPES